MWAYRVVVALPTLDHDPGFAQAVENLAIEQRVPQPGVEGAS